jgi:acyl carrier protein
MGHELTPRELTARMRELLAEILELNAEEIGTDQDLIDALDADSLQRLELMTEVEQEVGIRLDARAWRSARTLDELAELTLQRLGEPAPR